MINILRKLMLPFALVLLVATALFGIGKFQMQNYSSLNAGIKVAQVCAYTTGAALPTMYVHVILYGKDDQISFDNVYPHVSGEQVRLQGDIIKYSPALNAVGLQSGYKLTLLQGYYNDPKIERKYGHHPIILNGGDDILYQAMHGFLSVTPGVKAINDKPLSLMGDGHTYDIFVSQDGLFASKVSGPLACGL